jgi:hypothetical protein
VSTLIPLQLEVLLWRFTLVLIKINYGQIGDQQTQYFIPVEIDLCVILARLGIADFFHLSRRTTKRQSKTRIVSFIVPPYEVQEH